MLAKQTQAPTCWLEEEESNPLVLGVIKNSVGTKVWVNDIAVVDSKILGCRECSKCFVPTVEIVFIYSKEHSVVNGDMWKLVVSYEEDNVFLIKAIHRVKRVVRHIKKVTYEQR